MWRTRSMKVIALLACGAGLASGCSESPSQADAGAPGRDAGVRVDMGSADTSPGLEASADARLPPDSRASDGGGTPDAPSGLDAGTSIDSEPPPDGGGGGGGVSPSIQACVAQCPSAAACVDADRDGKALTCHDKVAAAFGALSDGARLVIRSGTREEAAYLRADDVEVLAQPGAHLRRATVGGKAAIVVSGKDAVIDGLECSEISVPDQNGACIRAEGANLTLRRVHFHDAEEGLLGGAGNVTVEDSTFERLGKAGYAHGIYVNAADRLVIRRCRFLSSKDQGHEIKSRAAATLIEDSTIATLDGVDSRLIDIPNGGQVTIRGNTLAEGPKSANSNVIGIGLEGVTHGTNAITIEHNWIINDRGTVNWLQTSGMPAATLRCNTTVGGTNPGWGGTNVHHATRQAAGLEAYPALPAPPRGACP